jgi:hypothetical protein
MADVASAREELRRSLKSGFTTIARSSAKQVTKVLAYHGTRYLVTTYYPDAKPVHIQLTAAIASELAELVVRSLAFGENLTFSDIIWGPVKAAVLAEAHAFLTDPARMQELRGNPDLAWIADHLEQHRSFIDSLIEILSVISSLSCPVHHAGLLHRRTANASAVGEFAAPFAENLSLKKFEMLEILENLRCGEISVTCCDISLLSCAVSSAIYEAHRSFWSFL